MSRINRKCVTPKYAQCDRDERQELFARFRLIIQPRRKPQVEDHFTKLLYIMGLPQWLRW